MYSYSRTIAILILLSLGFSLAGQSQNDDPSLFFEQDGQELKLFGNNHQLIPLTLIFNFELKGLKPLEDLPDAFILPAEIDTFLLATFSIPEGRSWSYKYSYSYYSGDANAKHDDEHIYLIPYQEHESFLLSQGYFSEPSHMKENALDFTMPEGSKICAARSGKVVQIKEDSNKGCPGAECNELGNYVRILHEDGTLADYFHLQQNGALVNLGEEVQAGEVIALAGDTGWASGSHLHFIVYKAGINGRISIPTLFKTNDAPTGSFLKEDRRYLSVR